MKDKQLNFLAFWAINDERAGDRKGLYPVNGDEVAFLDGVSASVKYGGVPWCEVLEDRYRKKYGESITD